MKTRVQDKDRGFKRLMRKLDAKVELSVGVHEEEGSQATEDGATIADVAIFHEFGTDDIPQRSFVRDWYDEKEDSNYSDLSKIAQGVIKGSVPSLEQGLKQAGMKFRGDVQRRIVSGIQPPLDEKTIDRKGSSTPLIDQGQLLGSIQSKVKKLD